VALSAIRCLLIGLKKLVFYV